MKLRLIREPERRAGTGETAVAALDALCAKFEARVAVKEGHWGYRALEVEDLDSNQLSSPSRTRPGSGSSATGGLRVDETSNLGFLTALGQEFCWALSPPVPDDLIVPQDGYEVWRRAFGADPSPAALATLTESQLEHLRAVCAGYFECPAVSAAQVQLAVSRTLARWPAE